MSQPSELETLKAAMDDARQRLEHHDPSLDDPDALQRDCEACADAVITHLEKQLAWYATEYPSALKALQENESEVDHLETDLAEVERREGGK